MGSTEGNGKRDFFSVVSKKGSLAKKKDVEMGSREMLVGGSRRHHKLHRSLLDLRFQIPLRGPGGMCFFSLAIFFMKSMRYFRPVSFITGSWINFNEFGWNSFRAKL